MSNDCKTMFFWKYMVQDHLDIKGKDKEIQKLLNMGNEHNGSDPRCTGILTQIKKEKQKSMHKLKKSPNVSCEETMTYLDLLHFQVLLSIGGNEMHAINGLYNEGLKELANIKQPCHLLEAKHRNFLGFLLVDLKETAESKKNIKVAKEINDKLKAQSDEEKQIDAKRLGITVDEYKFAVNRQHIFLIDLYVQYYMQMHVDHAKAVTYLQLFLKSVIHYDCLDAMPLRFVVRSIDLSTETMKCGAPMNFRVSSYAAHLAEFIFEKYVGTPAVPASNKEVNGFRAVLKCIFVQHLNNLILASIHMLKDPSKTEFLPYQDISSMQLSKLENFDIPENPAYVTIGKTKDEIRAMIGFAEKLCAEAGKLALKNEKLLLMTQAALAVSKVGIER